MENFDFFSELDEKTVKDIKSKSKYVEISKGTILFYEGDICKDVLYLIEGNIKLSVSANTNDEIPLYDFCQGEQCIVNIASAISQTKAVATAEAITLIKGYLIPIDVIQNLIVHSPSYQKIIFSLFTLRYSSLTTLIEDIKFKRLDSRILDFLKSFNKKEIKITNSEIAQQLGTSRTVINRVLQDLKNKNLIYLSRGKIILI
ncbi:Crp/Fnr family transcriptional regulator [Arcobacter lanthieri]|uniref:Crp/Fnr family transcriptional regulator n=1 Tax=Aliarcobacter lanthieri TaxID=1355374 RepID=UPI001924CDCF|nr:Crp/Fnr family transcriptional regulator [Aliarcobacter lanthieri]MBL3520714.1 Crp/Fnr family transcriptional regulator [Aliarcobacter lanthieri]